MAGLMLPEALWNKVPEQNDRDEARWLKKSQVNGSLHQKQREL